MKIFKYKYLFSVLVAALLGACGLFPNQGAFHASLEKHPENCISLKLVECVRLFANDLYLKDDLRSEWYDSYFPLRHIPTSWDEFHPYLDDNKAKADWDKMVLMDWRHPTEEVCRGFQCDRALFISFFSDEKISVNEFEVTFGQLQTRKKNEHAEEDTRSYIYFPSDDRTCLDFVIWVVNNKVETLSMFRHEKAVCDELVHHLSRSAKLF